MSGEEALAGIRSEIRRLTEEILRLMAERVKLSREVGRIKVAEGLPVEDTYVEKGLRSIVKEKSVKLGIDPSLGLRLLNLLITESVGVQRSVTQRSAVTPATMFQRAKQMEEAGSEVIHLEAGEPDFPPSGPVLDAVKEAIDSGRTGYTDPVGIEPLRESVAEHLNKKFHTDLTKEQVLITHGARFALHLAVATTLKPGGEALIFEPAYPAYRQSVELFEGRPVAIQTRLEEEWTPDIGEVEDLFDEPPDMIILNYPANPTGKVLNDEIFKGLVDFAVERGVTVLSDEVYMDYAYKPCRSILEYPDCRSIFASSFSKSYSMTGFRIGYAVASKKDIERMARFEGLALTCMPEFIQRAAIKAFECEENLKQNTERIRKRAEYTAGLLDGLPVTYCKPDGGFYIFPRVDLPGFDGESYALNLLEKHHVSVTPGSVFGDYRDHLRISLCQPEERLAEAVRRMKEALE
ncbi:MAG: aminotransferase class I/II-fold pyridoxal phosphate-dependent enzyme [Nitrososphaerales archaeon]